MRAGGVSEELAAAHREALTKVGDSSQLGELCERMQSFVLRGRHHRRRRSSCRRRLGHSSRAVVAVRSSATGEDEPRHVGRWDECDHHQRRRRRRPDRTAVRRCWASVYSSRVITCRASRASRLIPAIAIIMQLMIPASGGRHPCRDRARRGRSHHHRSHVGQGEDRGPGAGFEPDAYVVAKDDLSIFDGRIGRKNVEVVPRPSTAMIGLSKDSDPGALMRRLNDSRVGRITSLRDGNREPAQQYGRRGIRRFTRQDIACVQSQANLGATAPSSPLIRVGRARARPREARRRRRCVQGPSVCRAGRPVDYFSRRSGILVSPMADPARSTIRRRDSSRTTTDDVSRRDHGPRGQDALRVERSDRDN